MTETEQFKHAGLECKIVKQDMGHWCGYVKRPKDVEPVRWTSDYDSKHGEILEAEVDVWGGVTYGPDEDGWVGFDDAHACNLADVRERKNARQGVKVETQRLAEQIQKMNQDTEREE